MHTKTQNNHFYLLLKDTSSHITSVSVAISCSTLLTKIVYNVYEVGTLQGGFSASGFIHILMAVS